MLSRLWKRMVGRRHRTPQKPRVSGLAAPTPQANVARDAEALEAARTRVRWPASVLGALLLLLVGAALLPRDATHFASGQVQSVLAMLNLRSPGARAAGNLADSKPRLASDAPNQRALGKTFAPPQQRALGKIFSPQDVAARGAETPFAPPYQPDVLDSANIPVTPFLGPLGAPSGGGGAGGGGGGGGADSGGPGGGGGGGGPIGGELPPGSPVGAVPEPSTWLLMIVAFGLCGTMLRRRRGLHRGQASCHPAS